jgi:hypothetical protein
MSEALLQRLGKRGWVETEIAISNSMQPKDVSFFGDRHLSANCAESNVTVYGPSAGKLAWASS